MTNELQSFNTEQEAQDWMYNTQLEDEECVDNYRFAYTDDADSMYKFDCAEKDGCCGDFHAKILVGGREAVIGCNFGH